MAKNSSFEPYTLSLLRITAGFTFALHGFQKLSGLFGGLGHGASAHLFSLHGAAGVLETVGGLLILLGLYTRPVAFILCAEMAVAYIKQFAPHGFWPVVKGGELTVLYCLIFLVLVSAGAGPWSLDRLIRKK